MGSIVGPNGVDTVRHRRTHGRERHFVLEYIAKNLRLAEFYPTRAVAGHQTPLQLPQKLSSLDHFTYDLRGQTNTVDSHMRSERTAGLLVIHNGEIKVERYGLQHHADAP